MPVAPVFSVSKVAWSETTFKLKIKYCLLCPIFGLGDGEATGSYGNRPLPPFLSSPHDSDSSGTPSTDLPASTVTFLHLLCRRLL